MQSAAVDAGSAMQRSIDQLAQIVEQYREQSEQERSQRPEVIAALRQGGLLRLWVPREFGGDEIGLAAFMEAVESISRVDGAAGWTFANLAAGAVLTAFLAESGAGVIYAGGPDVAIPGSVTPVGRAIPAEGGYRLSGRWPLASGCEHGDWLGAVALVFDGEAPRLGPDGGPQPLVMFFSRRDAEILDTWYSLGLRGSGSTHFSVDDLFVPENLVFPLFTAPPRVSGPLYGVGIMGLFSLALTAVSLGIARAAIDEFIELAKNKTPTLSQTGLAVRPTVHAQLARAKARLGAARAYLYESASALECSAAAGAGVTEDVEAGRRLACVNAG